VNKVTPTFAALADPTRLEVIKLLSRQPRRAGDLAAALDVSPPALSRQLRVLRRAGLIREHGIEEDARVRIYELTPDPFHHAAAWLDEVRQYWSGQLQAFQAHVKQQQKKPRKR